ncbi:hypothetical protein [uncultured Methanobrevibacter sp.]|uniref:hypothetical protein n=1 Tax=uncultured Methanobrevibacter sp. TaxID=253161 RepID=UPI00260BC054
MDNLKKLYALLAVLIIIYVSINFSYNGLNVLPVFSEDNLNIGGNTEEIITMQNSAFTKLEGFTNVSVNESSVDLIDSTKGITIHVFELDNSQNLEKIKNEELSKNEAITSNQTLNKNGVTVYFIYEEGSENYNAKIYFNKNDQNYLISGNNIKYDDSDYFIKSCENIINTMNLHKEGFSRW